MSNTRQFFQGQRATIIERLRVREPELVRELEAVDLALQRLGEGSTPPNAYTRYGSASAAIRAHLERIKRTEDPLVIAQAVVDGGYQDGNPNVLTNLKNSVLYHVKHPNTKQLKKFPSGRVGLFDWTREFDLE